MGTQPCLAGSGKKERRRLEDSPMSGQMQPGMAKSLRAHSERRGAVGKNSVEDPDRKGGSEAKVFREPSV